MIKEYGYEYNAVVNTEVFSKSHWNSTDKKLWNAYCLRSGRDALKVIAKAHSGAKVYLPALCCDSMIKPFEMYNCEIAFYPLTNTLAVDYPKLLKKLDCTSGKILLLYFDYFGIPMFSDVQLKEIKDKYKHLVFIRDITHTLLIHNELEHSDDYTIASLRKWSNIPDGGLLWTDHEVNCSEWCESPAFAIQRLEAQKLRTVFFETGIEEIKKQYRKIFSSVSDLLDSDQRPAKMTEYSYQIASYTDWQQIREVRKENAEVLREIFAKCMDIKVIDSCGDESNLYVPILVNRRDIVQNCLSKRGIFNTIIWPLREEQEKCCKNTGYIHNHMLAVPCDQRYSRDDMVYIGEEMVRAVHEKNNDSGGQHSSASCDSKGERDGIAGHCGRYEP